MGSVGIYADLPVPDAWLPVLDQLEPELGVLAVRSFAGLGELADACLKMFEDVRVREMIWARCGLHQEFYDIAQRHQVTRERVRQTLRKAGMMWRQAKGLHEALSELFSSAVGRLVLLERTGEGSALYPGASSEQLWRLISVVWLEVYREHLNVLVVDSAVAEISSPELEARDAAPQVFLLCRGAVPRRSEAVRLLRSRASYLSGDELSQALEVSVAELELLVLVIPELIRTRSGLYGLRVWTMPEAAKALGEQLTVAGFPQWHFSEIGKALAVVRPEWGHWSMRNYAALFSRRPLPEATYFEPAGRPGFWRLVGDCPAPRRKRRSLNA